MKRATLVVNHNDALKKYSPTDFANYADIIRIGEIEARKMLPELQRLADEQHRHPTAAKPQHPADPQLPIDKIDFLTTTDQNIPPSVQKFAEARLGLKVDSIYTANQIRQATNRLYGSRFFENVYLAFDSTRLRVHLKNDDPDHLKVGLHYDSYSSVGVIVNYTNRHLGLPNSRFVATLAAAERLKGRANYQFYVDKNFRFWSKTFFNYENQTGKEVIGQYEDFQNYNAERYDYGTGLGYSSSVNSGFFLSFQREHHLLRRNRALRLLFDDVPIYAYNHVSNSLNLNWTRNTFNNVYFPTKGSLTQFDVSWRFQNRLELDILGLEGATDSVALRLLIAPKATDFVPSQVGRFLFRHQSVLPISPHLSLIMGANWGGLWDAKGRDSLYFPTDTVVGSSRYVFLNNRLSVGGTRLREAPNQLNFTGLYPGEIATFSNVTTFNLAIQYTPLRHLFLTPSLSFGFANPLGFRPFSGWQRADLHWFGYGVRLSYQSPIGPFVLGFEQSNDLWRGYFSAGFPF